jgi:hypothetical protein
MTAFTLEYFEDNKTKRGIGAPPFSASLRATTHLHFSLFELCFTPISVVLQGLPLEEWRSLLPHWNESDLPV